MDALLTPQQQRALAERVGSRDPAAEEEFVRLFAPRIGLMARVRLGDPEAARDLTQDVLLAVVRALRDGQLRETDRLTAFVFGIARNHINNYRRSLARVPAQDPLDEEMLAVHTTDLLQDAERSTLMRRAMSALDATSRTILVLTLVEGLKPGEIADRLGLTPEVVRTRKSRALRQVAKRVKKLSRI